MYPHVFDYKDYFTIAWALFTLFLIAFFLVWFFYDLKTKFNLREGQKGNLQAPEEGGEDDGGSWLDKNLLILMLVGTTLVYGLYFVLYYACRVFHAPWLGLLLGFMRFFPLFSALLYLHFEWHSRGENITATLAFTRRHAARSAEVQGDQGARRRGKGCRHKAERPRQ